MEHRERMEDLVVAERAAQWLQQLEQGGPQVHAEFGRWLRQSPIHVREVLLASVIRHAFKHLDNVDPSRVAEVKARFEESVVEINLALDRPDTPAPLPRPWDSLVTKATRWRGAVSRRGWSLTSTFAFVCLLAFAALELHSISHRTIVTSAGEWRDVQLDDGSLLRAGPRTKVSVEMADRRRLLRLAGGEIMVHVAPDHGRPFYVETDVATARAVGTAFAMRLGERVRATVTVKEGTVAVARGRAPDSDDTQADAVNVTAGQALVVTADQALTPRKVDVDRDLAWVQQKLILSTNGTVAEAIGELNRRNRIQIKLQDDTLGARPLRGVFSASDPAAFAEILRQTFALSVIRENDTLLLIAPTQSDEPSREH